MKIFYLLLMIVFISCQAERTNGNELNQVESALPGSINQLFAGLWKLHIIEEKDSATGKWKLYRNGLQGFILYDDKDNMAVHLTTPGYQNSGMTFQNFAPDMPEEQLKHITNNYNYFAEYRVDEQNKTVEHRRISHSNPNEWNRVVKRRYEFKGDTLILSPVESNLARLRLKWVKELTR